MNGQQGNRPEGDAQGNPPGAGPTATSLTPMTRAYVINLVLIGCSGVSLLAWLLRFTSVFPAVISLLAMGGIFSWLAFISNVLPKERLEQIQHGIDSHILSRS